MLCSHVKISPSCRRFPPQTRGEHLRCRSTGEPRGLAGRLLPHQCMCQGCSAGTNKSHFCTAPSPGGAAAAGCHLDFRDPRNRPVPPAKSSLLQPHRRCPGVLGAEPCWQEVLVPADTELCPDSHKHRNLGRV